MVVTSHRRDDYDAIDSPTDPDAWLDDEASVRGDADSVGVMSEWDGISLDDQLEIARQAGGFVLEEVKRRRLTSVRTQLHPALRLPPEVYEACVLKAITQYNQEALNAGRPPFPHHRGGIDSIKAYVDGYGVVMAALRFENWESCWIHGPDNIVVEYGIPDPASPAPWYYPGRYKMDVAYANDEHIIRTMKPHLAAVRAPWNAARPGCSAILPDGIRFEGTLPEIGSAAYVVLRHARSFVAHLEDLGRHGTLSSQIETFLRATQRLGQNVVVCGATGTGKTAFLRGLILTRRGFRRHLVTVEQEPELQLDDKRFRTILPQVTALHTRRGGPGGRGAYTEADLFRHILRMQPEQIIMGEVRGAEAWPWLLLARTGHRGSALTCHARGALDALSVLQLYCEMAETRLSPAALLKLICETVDLVIYLEQDEEPILVDDPLRPGKQMPIRPRRVREIVEITGYQPPSGEGSGHPRYRSLFVWDAEAGGFRWTGIRPRCADAILKRGWDLGLDLTAAREPAESDARVGLSRGE